MQTPITNTVEARIDASCPYRSEIALSGIKPPTERGTTSNRARSVAIHLEVAGHYVVAERMSGRTGIRSSKPQVATGGEAR